MGSKEHPFEGRVCGNYVLRRVLDQGGVGVVFEAEHRFLDEKAAIKLLHEEIAREEKDLVRRFFQEARATRQLVHPNIVKLLDFGQDEKDGVLYLVMELLEGESVLTTLERGPFDEREVARIGAAVADALQIAHDRGVIHRDLKPGNIFLCRDGTVKLLDFGLAKVQAATTQSIGGQFLGTPQYVAPEQVRDARRVNPKSDIYSLGAVLFRMLTGRPPFVAATTMRMIELHLTAPAPRPSIAVVVSKEMDDLVVQCLAKDPGERPSSMAELRTRLRRIHEQVPAYEPIADAEDTQSTVVDMTAPSFDDLIAARAQTAAAAKAAPAEPTESSVQVTMETDAAPAQPNLAPTLPEMSPPSAGELVRAAAPPGTVRVAPIAERPAGRGGAKVRPVIALAGTGVFVMALLLGALGLLWKRQVAQDLAGSAASVNGATARAATVEITSQPPGAKVLINDVARGVTPLAIALPLPTEIAVVLPGYQTVKRTIALPGPVTIELAPAPK